MKYPAPCDLKYVDFICGEIIRFNHNGGSGHNSAGSGRNTSRLAAARRV